MDGMADESTMAMCLFILQQLLRKLKRYAFLTEPISLVVPHGVHLIIADYICVNEVNL